MLHSRQLLQLRLTTARHNVVLAPAADVPQAHALPARSVCPVVNIKPRSQLQSTTNKQHQPVITTAGLNYLCECNIHTHMCKFYGHFSGLLRFAGISPIRKTLYIARKVSFYRWMLCLMVNQQCQSTVCKRHYIFFNLYKNFISLCFMMLLLLMMMTMVMTTMVSVH